MDFHLLELQHFLHPSKLHSSSTRRTTYKPCIIFFVFDEKAWPPRRDPFFLQYI